MHIGVYLAMIFHDIIKHGLRFMRNSMKYIPSGKNRGSGGSTNSPVPPAHDMRIFKGGAFFCQDIEIRCLHTRMKKRVYFRITMIICYKKNYIWSFLHKMNL